MKGIRDHRPAGRVHRHRREPVIFALCLVLTQVLGHLPAHADTYPASVPARTIPYPKKAPAKKKAAIPALLALPVSSSAITSALPISIQFNQVRFGNLVELDAAAHSPQFRLGHPFTVTLYWHSLDSLLAPHTVLLRLAMGNRTVIAEQSKALLEPEQEAISYAGGAFSQTFTLLVNETKWDLPPPLTVEVNVISGATGQPIGWQVAGGAVSKQAAFVLATLPRETLQATRCASTDRFSVTQALAIQAPTKGWLVQGYWFGHRGLDIANEDGQPIVAAMPGKVVMAEWSNDGFGFMVKIQHPNVQIGGTWMTLETIYAHMNLLFVAKDDEVQAGQGIGTVGVTGRSTGPHVHFEARLNGQPYNPFCLLPSM